MSGEGMGITPSWPMEANSGVRAGVRALQKGPEGEDRHTDTQFVHFIMIIDLCTFWCDSKTDICVDGKCTQNPRRYCIRHSCRQHRLTIGSVHTRNIYKLNQIKFIKARKMHDEQKLQRNHGSCCCYSYYCYYYTVDKCVKWRTSRLVSDSVLPHLHHWSSVALDYQPSGTEPFRLPLLASGTVYPSTSLLHLRCLSSGHASRLISSPFPIPVRDHVQFWHSDYCHLGYFNRSLHAYLLTAICVFVQLD